MTLDAMVGSLKAYLGPSPPGDDAIAQALVNTFADLSARADFWFMRSPNPTSTQTWTSGTHEYDVTINGCEKIQTIQTRATSSDTFSEIKYLPPDQFERVKAGLVGSSGTFWTVVGMVSPGKFRIHFYPTPTTSGQWRAWYMMVPDESTVDRLPNRWLRCLYAGALAELKGDSVQEARYEQIAIRMAVKEKAVTHFQGIYEVNDFDAARMTENADLQ